MNIPPTVVASSYRGMGAAEKQEVMGVVPVAFCSKAGPAKALLIAGSAPARGQEISWTTPLYEAAAPHCPLCDGNRAWQEWQRGALVRVPCPRCS